MIAKMMVINSTIAAIIDLFLEEKDSIFASDFWKIAAPFMRFYSVKSNIYRCLNQPTHVL